MDDAPSVSVIRWDDVSDFQALLHHAQGTDAEIISASATLRPQTDIEDVGQDLLDFANRSGYALRFI